MKVGFIAPTLLRLGLICNVDAGQVSIFWIFNLPLSEMPRCAVFQELSPIRVFHFVSFKGEMVKLRK